MKDLLRTICAFFIPPVGVALQTGLFNVHVLLSIILTILGWVPGILHALWVIWFMEEETSTPAPAPVPETESNSEQG